MEILLHISENHCIDPAKRVSTNYFTPKYRSKCHCDIKGGEGVRLYDIVVSVTCKHCYNKNMEEEMEEKE